MSTITIAELSQERQKAWKLYRIGKLMLLISSLIMLVVVLKFVLMNGGGTNGSTEGLVWAFVAVLGAAMPWLSLDWIEPAFHKLFVADNDPQKQ